MKVVFNQSIQAMWGRVGGLVFRRSHNGTVAVAAVPDMSRVKWSDAQQAHRQRFKKAVAYARAAMADETVRAKYVEIAAIQGKRPFDMAVSDYFKDRNLLEE